MKKDVLKFLSLSLILVILLSTLCVCAYAEKKPMSSGGGGGGNGKGLDDKVSIYVEFDKDEYIKGDTAHAVIGLYHIQPEAERGDIFQAYQSYISYDDSKLEFVDGDVLFDCEEKGVVKTENPVNGNSVLATYMYSKDGLVLSEMFTDNTVELIELTFTVKASVGAELNIGFDDTYEIEVITKGVEKVYEIDDIDGYTSYVVPGEASVISNLTEYDVDTNTASSTLDVYVTRNNGAVLIAMLYDTETNQLVAPVQTKALVNGLNRFGGKSGNELEFTLFDEKLLSRDLEVQYFVWDSIAGMKCISKTYADVVY